MRIVILGLSITSSWGNGHATTYRGLVRELAARGHDVLFLEHDKPWYAANRDLPRPPYGRTELYDSVDDLKDRFAADVRDADVVIVGSYVPEGVAVGEWVREPPAGVTAFYDIDTPVTLAKLERGDFEYLSPRADPALRPVPLLHRRPDAASGWSGNSARRGRVPLYCSVDPDAVLPRSRGRAALGPGLPRHLQRRPPADAGSLLLEPAAAVAGRAVRASPGRSTRTSIDWPAERRADRASAAVRASRVLQLAARSR